MASIVERKNKKGSNFYLVIGRSVKIGNTTRLMCYQKPRLPLRMAKMSLLIQN